MKRVPLKVLPADRTGGLEIDYRIILGDVLRRPLDPQRGIGLDEMRRSVRVLDALESADGTLDLEDADYDHLKEKLLAMPWGIVDRRILQLVDDITGVS
jgi:hypothetical protein